MPSLMAIMMKKKKKDRENEKNSFWKQVCAFCPRSGQMRPWKRQMRQIIIKEYEFQEE